MRCAILAFLAGACWLQTRAELPPPAHLACALAAALVLFALRKRPATLLAAAILGAAWSAWLAHAALADALPRQQEGRDVSIVGTVDSLPHEFDGGARFHLRVERVMTPDATVPPRIAISWYGQPAATEGLTPVEPGERWQLVVRLQRPHGNANPIGTGENRGYGQGWNPRQRSLSGGKAMSIVKVAPSGIFVANVHTCCRGRAL